MCGRFALDASWDEILKHFDAVASAQAMEMPPRLNIAPTQPIVAVTNGVNGREALLVRWGLIPTWVKEPKDFTTLINARSETATTKPSFKTAMRHRRALIPASGFYEWKRFGKGQKSQPYWVRPKGGGMVAFGGLVETYAHSNGSEMDTGCIMTTAANETFADIHHRLPLVVKPEDFERWLDCKTQEPRDVADLLKPVEDDYFEAIPVGDAVNKVANAGRDIQERVEPVEITEGSSETDDQMSLF